MKLERANAERSNGPGVPGGETDRGFHALPRFEMPADDTGKHDVDEAAATQQRAASKLGTSARQPSPLKPRPSSARGIPVAAPYVDDEELIEEMQTLMSPITDEVQACDVELVDDTVASFARSAGRPTENGADLHEPAPIDPPTIQHTKLRPSAPAMRRASQSMHAMPASVRASMPSRPPLPSQISSPASASRPLPPRRTMPSELPISERQPAARPIPPSGLRASSPDHADVAPTSRQGRQPRPSQHPTSRPPPLSPPHIGEGAFDETEAAMTMPKSSAMRIGFPAPQFSAPRAPQPFVPTAPITRKLVDDEQGDRESVEPDRLFHVRPELAPSKPPPFTFKLTGDLDLPPTSRRPATLPTLSEIEHIGPTTALAHPPVRLQPQPTALFGKNESPSLAPVAMGPPSRGVADMTAQLRPMRTGFGMGAARSPWLIAGLAFVVGTALAGSVLAFVALSPRKAKTASVVAATHDAKEPAAPSTVVVAPTTTYVPMGAPSASAMPSAAPSSTVPPVKLDVPPVIEADQTLVTFPASAKGHRVFVDGRPYAAVGDEPTPIRCGKHKIQIGSSGKPQPVVLPCGSELTIE